MPLPASSATPPQRALGDQLQTLAILNPAAITAVQLVVTLAYQKPRTIGPLLTVLHWMVSDG